MARSPSHQLPPLIAAMTRGDFYPHQPPIVELRQTHISYVFLAGERVYKVKKAVRLDFLDYSTLEKRRYFCEEEVRLNRRLAPSVYLGVVPIRRAEGRYFLSQEGAGASGIVEYAVKMERLPEKRMLSHRVHAGLVAHGEIRAIANRLASFHGGASAERAATYGGPEAVRKQILGNHGECQPFTGRTISRRTFERVRGYIEEFLAENEDLFRSRLIDGRVREGHGDLRAEHICSTDGVIVFDCVEFNEGFRYADVASEIGFLSMDLDFHSALDLAAELEASYAAASRDEQLFSLLPFYKCYRACVRGKVASLKSEEPEVPDADRGRAAIEAHHYFCLAHRYATGERKPALLVVCGLVATGKSTLARALANLTGFVLLQSDRIRKRLARLSENQHLNEAYRRGIYSRSFTHLTYNALLEEARNNLARGKGVVLDATFNDPEQRWLFLNLAASAGIPILFIECVAEEDAVRRRLRERQMRQDDVSDATWEIYRRMRAEFPAVSDVPGECYIQVDTEEALLDAVDQIDQRL